MENLTLAEQALRDYDRHGEYAMLCRLMQLPASTANRDRWRDNGLLFLSDGSEISHQGHKYRFGQPGWEVRDAALRGTCRPLPHIADRPLEVPVAMYDGSGPCRTALSQRGISGSLQILVTGHLAVAEAALLSPSGDPYHVLGVSLPCEDGDSILKPTRAYHYTRDFVEAIGKNGLGGEHGEFRVKPVEEFGLEAWASLFELCNQSLDRDWNIIESCVLERDFMFRNARDIANICKLPGERSE